MWTVGLENSTTSLVLFFEAYFDVAYWMVRGIVSAKDERVICSVVVAPTSGRSLMVNNNEFLEIPNYHM